jgi:APA family basic amino acid/polyamine antiporter
MVEHTRTLDFKIAFALGLGTMIAAGIFSLSGQAVAEIGSSAVIAFVLAAIVAGITAASYSEFASIYSENGGGYLFSSRTFEDTLEVGVAGRSLAVGTDTIVYWIGASLFLGYTGTTAFYLATMDEWFFRFIVPESLHALPHGTVGIAAALLLGALNARGTKESGTFQLLVTGAKVAVLLAFIAGALAYEGPAAATGTFVAEFQTDAVGIVSIAALAFITFFGFSAIAASAGEIIEPRKTVPKAIAASIVTVTVLYALVIVAMVNSPIPAEVIAEEGETAMGRVAAAFLGPAGQSLIVAGAVFSMVSASNASILAASGIGSLMGQRGQAPRQFHRIHRQYGTPFWSVAAATGAIVAMILVFIGLFPEEGGVLPLHVEATLPVLGAVSFEGLGLTALTGFATLNLLLPLSAVNLALIYSRRRYPDMDRPVSVPLVPWLPLIGVAANLALITNLPPKGIAVGTVLLLVLLVAYRSWGGAPEVEELFERVVEPTTEQATNGSPDGDRFRVLLPVARIEDALPQFRLAARLGEARGEDPFVQVLTVTPIPEQTPNELVAEEAEERTDELRDLLAGSTVDVDYSVEGHICGDVAFDILQTARDDEADMIVMGYPEDNPGIAEQVELKTPCDVAYASGFTDEDFGVVNVGAGGGPHHHAMLELVDAFGAAGSEIHVVSVDPEGPGTPEDPGETLGKLSRTESVQVHSVTGGTIADGLVSAAEENGGILLIGASRDRRLRRWVFGSTPDRVVELAETAGVPVVVYASEVGMPERIDDRLFPVYRYARRLLTKTREKTPAPASEQEG